MKGFLKIMLFVLIGIQLNGQAITNDTLVSLPYSIIQYQDFETHILPWTNFNGGTSTWNVHEMKFSNGTGGDRGVILNVENTPSAYHRLIVHVLDPGTNGIAVYSKWSDLVATIVDTGWHTIKFQASATGGGFGNKLIFAGTPGSATDTFKIGFVDYGELNLKRDILHKDEVYDSIAYMHKADEIYSNTFDNSDYTGTINYFGMATPSEPISDGYYDLALTGSQYVTFASGDFNDTMIYTVAIDIDIVTNPIVMHSTWGTASLVHDTITSSGKYVFIMNRRGPQANADLNGLVFNCPLGGTLKINELFITKYYERKYRSYISIGLDEQPILTGINAPYTRIGHGAFAGADATVMGARAGAGGFWWRGLNNETTESVAFGTGAFAGGWRTSAFGAEAFAGAQSSTAIGSGAECLVTHGFAGGRGSYINRYPVNIDANETRTALTFSQTKFYLGNGWCHKTPEPTSDQSRDNTMIPSTQEMGYYGQDAFDARYPQWVTGDTYLTSYVVYQTGKLYRSLIDANTANDPVSSPTQWEYWYDDNEGAAADFNISAGHTGLYAGRGTGSGAGGELRFYTAPVANSKSGNEKNDAKMAAKFISDNTTLDGTDLYLRDKSVDAMKRILINKKNNLSGSNNIIGFNDNHLKIEE